SSDLVGARGGLVGGDAHGVGVDAAQVDPAVLGGGDDFGGAAGGRDGEGVEERRGREGEPGAFQDGGQRAGVLVGAAGDRLQALRAVVDAVHGGGDGQQRLGGADVGGGLLAADVLLAGLQGQAVGGQAGVVLGDADEAAGQRALEALAHGHVGGVRAAEEQRHAQALGVAHGDVGALLARGDDEGQREDVGGDGDHGPALLGGGDDGVLVDHGAGVARLLQHDAGDVPLGQAGGEVGDLELEAQGLGAALDDGDGLREEVGVQDGLGVALGLVGAAHHQHGFGDGGG